MRDMLGDPDPIQVLQQTHLLRVHTHIRRNCKLLIGSSKDLIYRRPSCCAAWAELRDFRLTFGFKNISIMILNFWDNTSWAIIGGVGWWGFKGCDGLYNAYQCIHTYIYIRTIWVSFFSCKKKQGIFGRSCESKAVYILYL